METNRRGFTLIELLVVIAIIGLLSSVVLASLNTARSKANDAARLSNLREMQQAIESYASDNNGQYPNSGGMWNSTCSGWNVTTQNNTVPGLVPTYIPSEPLDSQVNNAANTCCYIYNANGTDYKYMFYDCPTSQACWGNVNSGFVDPGRPGYDCAIYTPGARTW